MLLMEKLITTLPLVLNGVDYIQGPGAIETSGTLCLEQIVVDEEIARLCKRLREGVDTSDEKDFYEDIKTVKPGGHFLTQTNTLTSCRSAEFLMPLLSDRNSFDSWAKLGRPDLYGKAQKKVEEILALDEKSWQERTATIEEEDKEISKKFVSRGLSHYAIKYNRFMGVISDYFTAED